MTIEEAINFIIESNDVQWNTESDQAVEAMRLALDALGKQERYRWHDLRKDPNDLPKNASEVLCQHEPKILKEPEELCIMHEYYPSVGFIMNWYFDNDPKSKTYGKHLAGDVYAWKYVDMEPFEEKNDEFQV